MIACMFDFVACGLLYFIVVDLVLVFAVCCLDVCLLVAFWLRIVCISRCLVVCLVLFGLFFGLICFDMDFALMLVFVCVVLGLVVNVLRFFVFWFWVVYVWFALVYNFCWFCFLFTYGSCVLCWLGCVRICYSGGSGLVCSCGCMLLRCVCFMFCAFVSCLCYLRFNALCYWFYLWFCGCRWFICNIVGLMVNALFCLCLWVALVVLIVLCSFVFWCGCVLVLFVCLWCLMVCWFVWFGYCFCWFGSVCLLLCARFVRFLVCRFCLLFCVVWYCCVCVILLFVGICLVFCCYC